jgi:thiazolinyl imide reductase
LALRVVIVGTKFGRVYLSAFRGGDFEFELAGILAQGSERSRACARYFRVPLFTDPDKLPGDVDIACVVVGTAVNGGKGCELAERLLQRGIHVLQEHPLHRDELVRCLLAAKSRAVAYRLNTHYVHIDPVRRFIAAAHSLRRKHGLLFMDAVCGVQTIYSLIDILGRLLGGLRPWAFDDSAPPSERVTALSSVRAPFRTLDGVIGGIPISLRVQNQLNPEAPDNHVRFYHRITLGTESGTLTLLDSHGPIIWCPRAHMPADAKELIFYDDSPAAHLDLPAATPLGPPEAPSYRTILSAVWPAGVRRALRGLRDAIETGEDPNRPAQYYLTLAELWRDAATRIRPLELIGDESPTILSGKDLSIALAAAEQGAPEAYY